MKSDKSSPLLLSSKRTKAYARIWADEAFTLPSFPESKPMVGTVELPYGSFKRSKLECTKEKELDRMKQTMLQHESTFRKQLQELHRLYQVQKSLMEQARSTDLAIHGSSCPPSSNNSIVYSSESYKAEEKQSWATMTADRPRVNFTQFSPFHVSNLQDWAHHEGESTEYMGEPKVGRRLFDLERPAEEYMDVEEYRTSSDTTALQVNGPSPCHGASSKSSVSSNPSSRWDARESSSVCVEMSGRCTDKNGPLILFPFEQSRCREMPLFPAAGLSKMEHSELKAPPALASTTKSHLGRLTGSNHEAHSTARLQHRDDHGEKRKELQLLDLKAKENPQKTPHWLQNIPADPSPALYSTSAQLSRALQPLPSIMNKHAGIATKHGCTFGETLKAGESWSSPYSGNMISIGSQSTWAVSPPSIAHDSDKRLCKGEDIHKPPFSGFGYLSTTNTVSQSSSAGTIATTTMFPPELSGRGTCLPLRTQSWCQQNVFSSLMQEMPKLRNPHQKHSIPSYDGSTASHPPSNGQQTQGAIFCLTNSRESHSGKSKSCMEDLQLTLGHRFISNEGSAESRAAAKYCPRKGLETNHDSLPFVGRGADAESERAKGRWIDTHFPFACFAKGSEEEVTVEAVKEDIVSAGLYPFASAMDLCSGELGSMQTTTSAEVAQGEASPLNSFPTCPMLQEKRNNYVFQPFLEKWTEEPKEQNNLCQLGSRSFTELLHLHDNSVTLTSAAAQLDSHLPANTQCVSRGSESFLKGKSPVLISLTSKEAGTLSPLKSGHLNTSSRDACESWQSLRQQGKTGVAISSQGATNIIPGDSCEESMKAHLEVLPSSSGSFVTGTLRSDCADIGDGNKVELSRKHAGKHFDHTNQAANILLSFASAVFPPSKGQTGGTVLAGNCTSLEWLVSCDPREGIQDTTQRAPQLPLPTTNGAKKPASDNGHHGVLPHEQLDLFESATLLLRAVSPEAQKLSVQDMDACQTAGEVVPNLRRSSRRRRAGRDFQRDVLASVALVSRQEIKEDLQIMEGLIRSTAEVMEKPATPSPCKEEEPCPKLGLGFKKKYGGTKGFASGAARTSGMQSHDALLRVCSWGEATRRRCTLRRQRSGWSCLPAGVLASTPGKGLFLETPAGTAIDCLLA